MLFRKLFGFISALTMVTAGLVMFPIQQESAEAAPPGSAFDPGLIISDSVFFDFGSMTLDEIQVFLDSRVSDCRATDPAIDCLKNYKTDIPDVPATTPEEVGPCGAIAAKAQASAAEVIFAIANACGINPKVLITTLQKEQGLVTSTKPTEYMYRASMGFGCPDSDPAICGKVYVGLFNQLYRAAKQFRWYGNPEGSFTYWKPGRTVSMRYNPKSSCGTKSFVLQNQATANLYYYTPYTPNDAALNNLYGTGDSCSAYGNRNFWRFFHDWFGSPIGGGYLLQAAGSETFLIVDNQKYRVTDARLMAALRPLGPLGEISQPYLDSFVTAGDATQLVKNRDTGAVFMLVDGIRYAVTDCAIAQQFGQSCDLAINLTALQLNNFVDGGELTRLIRTADGSRFWIENGQSRVVVDDLALSTVGAQAISASPMTIEQVLTLTSGPALASELVSFKVAGITDTVIAAAGKTYRFTPSLVAATNLTRWFTVTNAVVELQAISPTLHPETVRGFVKDPAGNHFVITADGKLAVSDPENWTETVVELPASLLAKIPTVEGILAAPAVVSSEGNKLSYFVQAGERRISSTTAMTNEFLSLISQPRTVILPQSAINTVPNVGQAIAPGTIVKSNTSSTLYLVDDLTRKVRLASTSQAKSVSNGRTFTFSSAELAKLETRTGFTSFKVQCNGETYLLDSGVLYPVAPEVAAHFPGTSYPLATATCAAMELSSRAIGQFIRDSKGVLYFVQDGVRKRISNWTHFANLRGEGPGYLQASSWFASRIPISGTAPATVELASIDNTPTGNFGELSFVGSIPERVETAPAPSQPATTTPAPAPEPSPAPAPAPAEPEVTEYRVQPGDSLNAIAARFGTTTSALQALNGISNPNLIRVGQLIKISASGASAPEAAPAPAPTPTPTPTPTPEPEPEPVVEVQEVEYRVQSGDTLLRIGFKFGVAPSVIQAYNNISNPNFLRLGQLLKIPTGASSSSAQENVVVAEPEPEPEPVTYKVKSGDSLWGIARKFGVSSSALAKLNGINNSNFIRIGQVLQIPS